MDPLNLIFQLTRLSMFSHHEFKMWDPDKIFDIRDLIVGDHS